VFKLFKEVCGAKGNDDAKANVSRVDIRSCRRIDDEDVVLVLAPVGRSFEALSTKSHCLEEIYH